MFSASRLLSKLTKANYIKIIRNHKRYPKRKLVQVDPGIGRRKKLVDNNEEAEELADHEFDLEADFMNVGLSHSEHINEIKINKERQKYLTVRQKYFKEKFPNFLTWSDKQQIRYLYSTNPEEWTIEKLSDGFPALPDVIAKVATGNWTKHSAIKIRKHDEAVKQNWKLFEEGKLSEFPPNLTEHLKKFRNRDINLKPLEISDTINVNTTKSMLAPNIKIGNEFSSIITSYESLKNKNNSPTELPETKKHGLGTPPKGDTYVPRFSKNTPHITLDKLKENIEAKAKVKNVSAEERLMLKTFEDEKRDKDNSTIQPIIPVHEENSCSIQANKSSDVAVIFKNKRDYTHLEYPEKIIIPKNILKPGYTYKLNDCFYDDDGEFLYRVPGMYK